MPKESLVINGFLGGINKDKDASDITSEDRQGKNELVTCDDVSCHLPGKVVGKRPTSATSTDISDGASGHDSTDDLLIYDGKYYSKKGVYKVGTDIEWSGKSSVYRPLKATMGTLGAESNVQTDTIGLTAFGESGSEDTNTLFLGKLASQGLTNCVIADNVSTGVGDSTTGSAGYVYRPRSQIRFGADDNNDERFTGTDVFDDFNHMGDFDANSDWSVALWDDTGSNVDLGSSYGWSTVLNTGSIVQAGYSDSAAYADLTGVDYIRFGRNASTQTNNDIAVVFRTGNMELSSDSDEPLGLYGTGINLTDKDIFVEIEFNSDEGSDTSSEESGAFWNGFTGINVTMVCDKDDAIIHYSDSDFDKYTKTWEVSKAALSGYGCEVVDQDGDTEASASGGGRFKIPWGAAIHTGSNFSSVSIKAVLVVLIGGNMNAPDHTDPKTIWCARLYELSFESTDTIGWANSNTKFTQSRVYKSALTENRVESLPQPYTSYLSLVADTALRMSIYRPNAPSDSSNFYEGNIYYQSTDDNGVASGALFLLAEVSRTKGVKSILSDFHQPWETTTLASAAWDGGTNTVTFIANNQVRPGMLITGHADIGVGVYITAVASSNASLTLSTTIGSGGVDRTGQSITADGIIDIHFSDPPVSATYQLKAGYSPETETINAQWSYATTLGRQVYIGRVAKTGDYLPMSPHAVSANTTSDMYPLIDTTGWTQHGGASSSIEYRVKITNADTPDDYQYNSAGGSYEGTTAITAETWLSDFTHGLKVLWPVNEGYTVGDIWKFTVTRENDLVLKSAIGKYYGFPNLQYIDLEIPGDGITALASSGDRLFAFSTSVLNVINIAQDYEFLEGTFQGSGVANPKQVVPVQEGVAFVNANGVTYFDGNKMESLTDNTMLSFDWSDAANGANIGYYPAKKMIIVWHTTNKLYAYSLVTKSWVSNSNTVTEPTTRVGFHNNIAHYLSEDSAINDTITKIVEGDSTSNMVLTTGKISCGDLSRNKKFKKVYVTAKEGFTNSSNCFMIQWSIDGGSYTTASDNKFTVDNGINTFTINAAGKTIQFKFTYLGTADTAMEISDISLIYRNKTVK